MDQRSKITKTDESLSVPQIDKIPFTTPKILSRSLQKLANEDAKILELIESESSDLE